ncbi:MAG: DUF4388 domain-containing protein [Acidobacteriota bacterium]
MPLNGTLSTMALPDLLQWLSTSAKTGHLALSHGRFHKDLFLRDGVIVSSASNDPREYLGQFLLSEGKITEKQLRMGMETQRSTGVMLGKILIMLKALDEEELVRMLTLKAEESIFALFLWNGGTFNFEDQPLDLKNLLPLALRIEDVLLEGLRRYDELQVILKAFSPGDSVLSRTDQPLPESLARNEDARRLMELVDGGHSLAEICLEMHASEFKISRVAYDLYRKGVLKVAPRPSARGSSQPQDSPAELVARADSLMEKQKFDQALDLLEAAVAVRPADLALKLKMDRAERLFMERAYKHILPPSDIPVLKKTLESLTGENLTPEEGFLVSRLNGTWTIKDIITVSPLREVEALRVLARLRSRGVIELRHPPE